jgi:hypothetical protein
MRSMSQMGHSRRFGRGLVTSGLPRSADIDQVSRHVSKVPQAAPSASDYTDHGALSYFDAESFDNSAIASCTVVINCAGKMMVEFFSTEISAIV